ncbi:lichenan operon transcriptional antiterminator [Streptohalobacillus salinus]|uniref:Lichenan operon transcriptional antiterminator n=1 Tax=Streptohalobacillus salinus TaxID=621096 RepID=A0A2V3WD07_9BACI|nr:PRD domain-containing protein [Streptohalobacillus salinus]PXW92222.1 lichenan operon transcriptional antiterminator [Streptohalobacillus salinus]
MQNRINTILQELIAKDEPMTGDALAALLDVSSRTIRDDIKQLDYALADQGAYIKSTRGLGYTLIIEDEHAFRLYLQRFTQSEQEDDFTQPDQRVRYLIHRFLLAEQYLKLDDLIEEMHISRSTIQSDLRQVKEQLRPYDLILHHKPNYGLKLQGTEVKVRFALSQFLFNEREVKETMIWKKQLATISNMTESQLQSIWTLLIQATQQHQISLSDIAMNNLFIHIAIAYKRIKDGHQVSLIKHDLNDITNQREYTVALEIVRRTENILHVAFPDVEIAYIAIHLLGTKMVEDKNQSEEDIKRWMPDDILIVTEEILETIERKLSLGIQHDKELIFGLCLHLKPAINRFKYGMNVRNPMLQEIKQNYPLAFEAGILAGIVLEEELDVAIDENEVGYLALHIGAAIERKKLTHRPITCYIVCASGVGSAQLIKYKLQGMFGSKINILGTSEYYKLDQLPFSQLDLIVSSVPIKVPLPVPVVEVNTILTEQDVQKVETFIDTDHDELLQFIDQDAVFLNQCFDSKEETLSFLVDALKEKLALPDDYLTKIYEREAIAPTAFGNLIAIPHPITAETKTTKLGIVTLKKPIDWAGEKVQVVILLNVKKESNEDLQALYKLIGKLVENRRHVQQVAQATDYEQFIDHLFQSK